MRRFNFTKTELALAIALGALVLQLFPPLIDFSISLIDFRRWSQSAWLLLTSLGLCCLLGVYFAPQLLSDYRDWIADRRAMRIDKAKKELAAREKERLTQIRKSRSRRIY